VATQLVPMERNLSQDLLGVARMALGGPAILLVAGLLGHVRLTSFLRLQPLALAGFALGCMVFQVCLFRAFKELGVTATVFLTVCLPPILSCGFTLLSGRKALAPGTGLALGMALAGLSIFALGTGQDASGAMAHDGLVLALLASIAFVAMTGCARALGQQAGPIVVAGSGLTLAGLGLFLVVLLLDPGAIALPTGDTLPLMSLVAYLVLGPTALAYVAYCSGMARCRSAGAGLIASMIEPGLAALMGWAILGERLSPAQSLGCILIGAAMLALWASERRAEMG